MLKHPGSPESVGRGVAVGLFSAFIIPFSLQMLVAFPLAVLVRGARVAALLSTWVSNPLTIPFIYPLQCLAGSYLIGKPLSYAAIRKMSGAIIETPSIGTLLSFGWELVLSFLVGGLIFGVLAAAAGYPATVMLVKRYRIKKTERREKRATHLSRRAFEKTGI
ncbi:MAG: DUF2062 domain-containing protein [Kiritimatiellales bacterium]|nr:DUF2062 domain-containing protein [Kiritimatiellales bacterium]